MSKVTKAHTATIKHGNRYTPVDLAIPAGLAITNQTAMGIDPNYNFIADLSWLPKELEFLRHDLTYSGYNVPSNQLQEIEEYHGSLFLEQQRKRSNINLRNYVDQCGYIESLRSHKKFDISLTENDIDQLVCLLGKYCRCKALRELRSVLTYGLHHVDGHSIFERVVLESGVWRVVGAQCYNATVREIRKSLI